MIQENTPAQTETPPEDFVRQVKDVLEHLHDLGYLRKHPLVDGNQLASGTPANAAVQHLRGELVAAIEALSPGKNVPFRAPHARVYNLLLLHYVDRMTIREAAGELGISSRQADRDLRQGEQSVAAVLWDRHGAPAAAAAGDDATMTSSLDAEMALLEVHLRPADLCSVLQRALESVKPLATQREVRLQSQVPAEALTVSTDPLLAEQVFLNILSRGIRQAEPGAMRLNLASAGDQILWTLRYVPEDASDKAQVADPVISQLVERLHWQVVQGDRSDGLRVVTVHLTTQGPVVLVIDDNEGLVSLLQRYLTDQACRVVAATNGQEGLRMAQELLPEAIVLDIMMPDMHGWDVLQRIRANRRTADIPVIICSVINNPDLAQALGASAFMPKPVRQEDILVTLGRLGVV